MLTPAELAVELKVSTRHVQRLTAAGMPFTPTGAKGKRYDLHECQTWLRNNPQCLSNQPKQAATKSLSASIVKEFTGAFRKAQVRVKPSEWKPNSEQPSAETERRLSLVTPG